MEEVHAAIAHRKRGKGAHAVDVGGADERGARPRRRATHANERINRDARRADARSAGTQRPALQGAPIVGNGERDAARLKCRGSARGVRVPDAVANGGER